MSTQKEIVYNVAYEKHSVDCDASYATYQAEITACEEAFKAAEYVAAKACQEKSYSEISNEKDEAIALAKRARDAAKALASAAHAYAGIASDAALEAAKHASYDADAIAANVAHYKAAYDAKKIAADKAAESPYKVAADKAAYKEFNDMRAASSKEQMAYLVKSHGGY